MIRHPFDRDDVDLDQLKAELVARLGRPIELLTSDPTVDEPDGVLIVEDPDTGKRLDVDPAAIAQVVSAHTPVVRLTAEEQALAAFEAATTVVERLAVFRAYLARQVADQQSIRDRVAQDRERRRRERREAARGDQP